MCMTSVAFYFVSALHAHSQSINQKRYAAFFFFFSSIIISSIDSFGVRSLFSIHIRFYCWLIVFISIPFIRSFIHLLSLVALIFYSKWIFDTQHEMNWTEYWTLSINNKVNWKINRHHKEINSINTFPMFLIHWSFIHVRSKYNADVFIKSVYGQMMTKPKCHTNEICTWFRTRDH